MSDIAAVQKRPGMYIGDTSDGSGLNNMVRELVGNAIAEVLAGYADRIEVVLNPDGSCTVRDSGRGIPVNIHESAGVSAAQVIMTRIVPFWALTKSTLRPKVSGTFLGVDAVVVNALSEWLELLIWRDGNEHVMRFRLGAAEAPLALTGQVGDGKPRQGTQITFLPSAKFFTPAAFDVATLEEALRRLVLANGSVNLVFRDRRGAEERAVVLTSGSGIT
jgi:DNA gyrase subunit B